MSESSLPPSEPELTFPARFGRYTLKRRLGEGGMGEIYLASLTGGIEGVEKPCVIKKLRRMYSHDEEFVTRFLDEARLMVQLSHANIVPVFDAGSIDGDYYLAMEFVDGVDLRDLIQSSTRANVMLPTPVVLYIAREILAALGYAHKKKDRLGVPLGLVHRDISPQNILCSMAGEVKLIDFGLAKSAQKVLKTDPRVVLGKYAYMSPEQARGQPVDGRSDLFSVGLLIFEMMTNRKLFDGVTVGELMEQIAEHRVFPPSQVREDVDDEVDRIIVKALLKDSSERFQTAEEFRDALSRPLLRLAPTISSDELAREVRRSRGELSAPYMPAPPKKKAPAQAPAAKSKPAPGRDEPTQIMGTAPAAPARAEPALMDSVGGPSAGPGSSRSGAPASGDALDETTEPVRDVPVDSEPTAAVAGRKKRRKKGVSTVVLAAGGLVMGVALAGGGYLVLQGLNNRGTADPSVPGVGGSAGQPATSPSQGTAASKLPAPESAAAPAQSAPTKSASAVTTTAVSAGAAAPASKGAAAAPPASGKAPATESASSAAKPAKVEPKPPPAKKKPEKPKPKPSKKKSKPKGKGKR